MAGNPSTPVSKTLLDLAKNYADLIARPKESRRRRDISTPPASPICSTSLNYTRSLTIEGDTSAERDEADGATVSPSHYANVVPSKVSKPTGTDEPDRLITPETEIFPAPSPKYFVPYFIFFVSLFELGVFLYHVVHINNQHCMKVTKFGPFPHCSALTYNPKRRYEVWRLITYMFVHSGYLHILNNIIVQLILGLPLEIVHGPLRVSAVYMAGVLTGSLVTSISDPTVYLAGASGGVYALLGAYVATLIMNWKEFDNILQWMISILVLLVGIIDLGYAIYNRYIIDDFAEETIGYAAHLGGAGAGVLIGMNVLKNFVVEKWEGYLRMIFWLIWMGFLITADLVNAFGGSNIFLESDFSKISECEYYNHC